MSDASPCKADPSTCNRIEEICGVLETLNIQTEAEKQTIINSLSRLLVASNSAEIQSSSTKHPRAVVDAEAEQYAARIAEHKQKSISHLKPAAQQCREGFSEQPNIKALPDDHTEGSMYLQQMEERITANTDDDIHCSEGIQVALEKLTNSAGVSELMKRGTSLIEEVKEFQKLSSLNILAKIQFIQGERDSAMAMERKLGNEVSRLNHEMTIMQTEFKLVDKTRVKALQTQLQALNKERDELRQKNEKLEDTVDTLKLMHSLQRSLSKEEDLKTKYERDLQSCKSEIIRLKESLERVVGERNLVVEERNKLLHERNDLAIRHQEEYERAERFQRLVVALRQRARGT